MCIFSQCVGSILSLGIYLSIYTLISLFQPLHVFWLDAALNLKVCLLWRVEVRASSYIKVAPSLYPDTRVWLINHSNLHVLFINLMPQLLLCATFPHWLHFDLMSMFFFFIFTVTVIILMMMTFFDIILLFSQALTIFTINMSHSALLAFVRCYIYLHHHAHVLL